MDGAREVPERSEPLEYDSLEYDSESRYLFDDMSTTECSILSEFGWATTSSNLHLHRHRHHHHHQPIDDPFIDFATSSISKSESIGSVRGGGGGGSGLLRFAETPPVTVAAEGNTSCGASRLVEQASTSNPSVSSSSSDQDLAAEKSIGSGETPPSSLQIPSGKSKKKGQPRIRQPRFAFVTKSEVDHLEDGYRWRKYGQKAVKNSPYPRSYYRCTNTKCTVKKRVERSCEDPTTVITTYEGQHCHQIAGFPRGGALSIRGAAFGGQMGPPNSQYYYPGMQHVPHQSPNSSAAPTPIPTSVTDNEPKEASRMMILSTEPQLPQPASTPQVTSDEGLLGDIVSPRRRNLHP
uniref:WRKY domain-containing protein n=1 Tax=Kalanchoe fedtschenkoi TaxID=63787 RepID=A0A7N0UJL3_KALFE